MVRVTDGDSVWWKPEAGGQAVRVRLKGIDAPEICQQHGAQSRQALQDLVTGRRVRLARLGLDDHGRVLARLSTPEVRDVAARLVEDGQAWSYRFQSDEGPYVAEERRAAAGHKGLHNEAGAQLPRQFRQRHGPCR